jgi:Phosphotransferase enzyme family
LRATQRVQRVVHQSGFPCPSPIAGPLPFGHRLATIESFLSDPGLHRPEGDELLERSSAGLVRLLRAAAGEKTDGLDLHPFRIAPGDLYPTPHSPGFDFPGTSEGAEWIDEIARAAWVQRERADGPPVIAHMDWSARNVRFNEHGVCAVYDWDSLSLASEAVVAGQSAATWRSTGSTSDVLAPGSAEIEQYLAAFGAARGTPLSASELSAARSAAVWVMAYSARCEHALELRTPYVRHRARHWLRIESSQLL